MCQQVVVAVKARLPAMDGSQCSTPPYFKTPDGQPLRFTMGASVWLAGRPSHQACFTDGLLFSSCTSQLPIALETCFRAMHAAHARAIESKVWHWSCDARYACAQATEACRRLWRRVWGP